MVIVGFYIGHNASVCVMRDGKIIAAASEERFNRIKNANMFPKQALSFCLKEANVKPNEVGLYVRGFEQAEGYVSEGGQSKISIAPYILGTIAETLSYAFYLFPSIGFFSRKVFNIVYKYISTPYFQRQFKISLSKYLDIDPDKILFANHHLCHAYAAYYGFVPVEKRKNNFLVITFDGEGDGLCGTVNMIKKKTWRVIGKTVASHSIAKFYEFITYYLGMKRNEHEYKVMGLAPYASMYEKQKVYPSFMSLFTIHNLTIRARIPTGSLLHYFKTHLFGKRFDGVSGAAQDYVEDLICDFVRKCIQRTKIDNIAVGGGLFMNVKVNQKIAEMKEVESFYPCPSSGDESIIFGAAHYGYETLCKRMKISLQQYAIENVYLGSEYSDREIKKCIDKDTNHKKYSITKHKYIEDVIVKLLVNGYIVARFSGRMEWGARALGNRSILMDPSRLDLKQQLNVQVKSRDFWMPFAATILESHADIYLHNPKKLSSPFMMMTFDTHENKRSDIIAAIHPHDFTCRAQILREEDNQSYYKIIRSFQSSTGIGALLNTSFNYHGEPIVNTPQDALHTFQTTDLRYLALGSYLIKKKSTTK